MVSELKRQVIFIFRLVCFVVCVVFSSWLNAQISVVDDLGNTVVLDKPATRIVSLSPHLTENLFSIGAADAVIAVSAFSDFPDAAKKLPSVGDFQHINVEKIVSLKPDLVVAWADGGDSVSVQQLSKFNIPVYWSKPNKMSGIIGEYKNLGVLTGSLTAAGVAINNFQRSMMQLNEYRSLKKVSVFYQVWSQPLQTLNKNTLINDVIDLCGGVNVFSDATATVALVTTEDVIAKQPDVILGSHSLKQSPDWIRQWDQWSMIPAVKNKSIYSLNADWLSRHTSRILLGAKELCDHLDEVRGDQ